MSEVVAFASVYLLPMTEKNNSTASPPEPTREKRHLPMVGTLVETFGLNPAIASGITLFLVLLFVVAGVWVVRSAPPDTITLTSGPEGSNYQRWAEAYQKALATHGVTLKILPSAGSRQNLQRLQTGDEPADLGFVAGGPPEDKPPVGIFSLGSVAHLPLWVFYRNATPIARLSELAGKQIGVGAPGSSASSLARILLLANGIAGPPTTFVDLDAAAAAAALLEGRTDAVFLMGDSASLTTLRSLTRSPEIRAFNFTQADAYVRRHPYLGKITLPQGSFDLGKNLPAQDLVLIGPTVELVARKNLNPALSDLLLEVAKEVHGKSGIFQRRGEFPAPLLRDLPLSEDAVRYYKSGQTFLYRTLDSFWLASLLNRILVAVVPLALVLIPAVRFLPLVYRLTILLRLYRYYRPLLRIERETLLQPSPDRARDLLRRLGEIEMAVNRLKVPASFGDRLYWLRSHLGSVRQRLQTQLASTGAPFGS